MNIITGYYTPTQGKVIRICWWSCSLSVIISMEGIINESINGQAIYQFVSSFCDHWFPLVRFKPAILTIQKFAKGLQKLLLNLFLCIYDITSKFTMWYLQRLKGICDINFYFDWKEEEARLFNHIFLSAFA